MAPLYLFYVGAKRGSQVKPEKNSPERKSKLRRMKACVDIAGAKFYHRRPKDSIPYMQTPGVDREHIDRELAVAVFMSLGIACDDQWHNPELESKINEWVRAGHVEEAINLRLAYDFLCLEKKERERRTPCDRAFDWELYLQGRDEHTLRERAKEREQHNSFLMIQFAENLFKSGSFWDGETVGAGMWDAILQDAWKSIPPENHRVVLVPECPERCARDLAEHLNKGTHHQLLGQQSVALFEYKQAVALAVQLDDADQLLRSLLGLADTYGALGDRDSTAMVLRRAAQIPLPNLNDAMSKLRLILSLAAYSRAPEDVREDLRRLLECSKVQTNPQMKLHILMALADLHRKCSACDDARQVLEEACSLAECLELCTERVRCLCGLADVTAAVDNRQSVRYLCAAWQLGPRVRDVRLKHRIAGRLHELYGQLRDDDKAEDMRSQRLECEAVMESPLSHFRQSQADLWDLLWWPPSVTPDLSASALAHDAEDILSGNPSLRKHHKIDLVYSPLTVADRLFEEGLLDDAKRVFRRAFERAVAVKLRQGQVEALRGLAAASQDVQEKRKYLIGAWELINNMKFEDVNIFHRAAIVGSLQDLYQRLGDKSKAQEMSALHDQLLEMMQDGQSKLLYRSRQAAELYDGCRSNWPVVVKLLRKAAARYEGG